jgi:hypothetical protein
MRISVSSTTVRTADPPQRRLLSSSMRRSEHHHTKMRVCMCVYVYVCGYICVGTYPFLWAAPEKVTELIYEKVRASSHKNACVYEGH